MPGREQRLARADWSMTRDLDEAGGELRRARLRAGLTAQTVALAIGISRDSVQRNERGHRGVPPLTLARQAAAVGLRARIRLYPDGEPIHDRAQLTLIRRFRSRVGEPGSWAFEVPVALAGDQRAFDAVLTLAAGPVAIEFFTRLADVQAQLRAVHLKKRDAGMARLIVVVQATHANRRALREASPVLAEFPGTTRQVLTALAAGRAPASDSVILF